MNRPWGLFAAVFWVFTLCLPAQVYFVTNLGTLGGTQSFANAINSSGVVVGFSTTTGNITEHAARFSGNGSGNVDLGSFGELGSSTSNSFGSYAADINDSGQIVGSVIQGTSLEFAVLFNGTGSNNLNLGGIAGALRGRVNAINNAGVIIGTNSFSNSVVAVQFNQDASSTTRLSGLGPEVLDNALDINSSGLVVGTKGQSTDSTRIACLFDAVAGYTFLTTVDSRANAINDLRQIVGYAGSTGHATLFNTIGSLPQDLGTLGGTYSEATAINHAGLIVGYSTYTFPSSSALHGFIFRGGVMIDLNNLIPAGSGIVVESASDINDKGQIAANGRVNGEARALRLDPAYRIGLRASSTRKGTVRGSGVYAVDKWVTVTASPKRKAVFRYWTENRRIVSRQKRFRFHVTKARNLVAVFR